MGDIPALIAEGRRLIAQATPGPLEADEHGVVRAGPVRHYTRGSGRSQLLAVMMVELGDSDTAEAMLSRRIADTALFPFAVNHLAALLDVAEAAAAYQEELAALGNGVDPALSAALSALGLVTDGERKEKSNG